MLSTENPNTTTNPDDNSLSAGSIAALVFGVVAIASILYSSFFAALAVC